MPRDGILPASFRDPSGFVFRRDGQLYRQVNRSYRDHYDHLMQSGLYDALVRDGLLIPHHEVGCENALNDEAYRVLSPLEIPFISYPYEWCFSQLKHAALLTLDIQRRALESDMSLKDCSAYNVQFSKGKPILIDSLSLERYQEGKPWVAYQQFCRHFLAPLALMAYVDVRLHQLCRADLEGIPLDLASRLLPLRTRADLGLLSHIHLHTQAEKHMRASVSIQHRQMSKTAFLGLVENLRSTVQNLGWVPQGTEWHDYYAATNYTPAAMQDKALIVSKMLGQADPAPKMVWDLGANTGLFSRLASDRGVQTVSLDMDPAAVEKNYREVVEKRDENLLPLWVDLANPSAASGWDNQERMSLLERGPADIVLALALVHHLAIGHNLPFAKIARFLSGVGRFLILEFVPKEDAQTQKLLANREDIFDHYDQDHLERAFAESFAILGRQKIAQTDRTIYLMARRCE